MILDLIKNTKKKKAEVFNGYIHQKHMHNTKTGKKNDTI